jgi:hypothetical protein
MYKPAEILLKVRELSSSDDNELSESVDRFIERVNQMQYYGVSAGRFVTLTRSFIFTMLSFIATYLVILLQED